MFDNDKEKSLQVARQYIYPVLKKKFGNSVEIISVEESATPLARRLDTAGNDIMIVVNNLVAGINSRCHKWSNYPKTFTIRQTRHGTPAEYDRIKEGLQHGGLTPSYFAQVYSKDNDDYAEVGIIETNELFNFVGNNSNDSRKVATRNNGNVQFLAVAWQYLKDLMETYAVKGKQVFKLK